MSRLRILGILVAVILPAFMTALDGTVVNVALPQIQTELALDEAGLKWVAAVYPLTHSSFLLFGGHLADSKGRRLTLSLGVAVFALSSILCSVSTRAPMLITGRGLQGVGAALILPAALAVLSHDLPPRSRNAGFTALTVALATALAGGPVLSGVITEHWGWNWLFVINAPIGLVSFLACAAFVPRPPSRPAMRESGVPAAPLSAIFLACIAIGGFAYCLIEGPQYGFVDSRVLLVAAASLVSLIALAVRSSLHGRGVFSTLFARRAFTCGLLTQLLWGLGVSGVYFFTALFLQNYLRLSPTSAGLMFTPVAASLLATAPFVAKLARLLGDAKVAAAGMFLVALGLLLVSLGSRRGGLVGLLPGLVAIGVGSGLAVPLTTRALESAPDRLSGVAAGLFSATREASGVFGIAVIGLIVTSVQSSVADRGAGSGHAFLIGYQAGLCTAAALVAIGVPVALWGLRARVRTRQDRRGPAEAEEA
ncbi:MFS transporter [Streptomyces actuosus]|uniref:MFS transporter n=1 Tax=Streptomyces actuosus TaxID=1885 RepID=A0ABS2VKL9_STRAS|nr:MFS transporter [Streptomyces actuosus]MBN0043609.1 MFS transporter [Streptomyces actuosus]